MTPLIPIIKVELLAGAKTRGEFSRLKLRLDALQEITLTDSVWEEAQEAAFRLRRAGLEIPLVDILILSCSKHAGTTLGLRDPVLSLFPIFLTSLLIKT